MKARVLSIVIPVILFSAYARAQLVFIPDTMMQQWFNAYAPGSIDSLTGMLDTGAPELQGVTTGTLSITPAWSHVSGLEYLTNLADLDIWVEGPGCTAFLFDAWPPSLSSLRTDSCALASLPEWPSTLSVLNLGGGSWSGVADVPWPLPASLTAFEVIENQHMQSLPPLPSGLTELYLDGCVVLTDVGALPDGLITLDVTNSAVQDLSSLPPNLESLNLVNCLQLSSVGTLSSSLYMLNLSVLPGLDLPPACPPGVHSLGVDSWIMEYWNDLPDSLTFLSIGHDWQQQFQNGDPYPGMCIPTIPDGTQEITVVTYPIIPYAAVCLPNAPMTLYQALFVTYHDAILGEDSYAPIYTCVEPDVDCPLTSTMVKGVAFTDDNGDGVMSGELPRQGAVISVEPGGMLTSSDAVGNFHVFPGLGSFTVTGVLPIYHTVTTPDQAVNFTLAGQVDSLDAIGYHSIPGMYDLVLDMGCNSAVAGFDNHCWLYIQNVGTSAQDGTVTLDLDLDQSFVTADVVPANIDGNSITWSLPNLPMNSYWVVEVQVHTDAGVAIATPVDHFAEVTAAQTDLTPVDNLYAYSSIVHSSFDPNDKTVTPAEMTVAQLQADAELEYTIRFQNTGNYPAQRVVITDTLSGDLQWNTMRLISSSDPCTWYLAEGVLHFVFEDINLPDSTSDGPGSHGFVKFGMEANTLIPVGASVENVANIYFDFNAPVITAPAVFEVVLPEGVDEANDAQPQALPNPAHDRLFVRVPAVAGPVQVEVLDAGGRVMMRAKATAPSVELDVRSLAKGLYTMRLSGDRMARTLRFVKD
ncbi:MAG TPA: T9SS type A sorting domain-containing protein [Flavobacteriales bacterium]|nr:T9SS type A sorting domain-containing protein [Flavobacteriales bacterium]